MTAGESARATAERLAGTVDRELSRLVEPGTDVALLSFPKFGNLGDAAMWLGELAALDRAGARIRYRCDPRTYRRRLLRSAIGDRGTILLHGGGNIGDVYPLQQRVREGVLRDFPEAHVIQLPQTIWFRKERRMSRFGQLCRGHPNFTLMVRERESVARAREGLGLEPVLCPDSAFALGPLQRSAPPSCDLLWLLREDRERTVVGDPALAPGAERREWPDKFGGDAGASGRGLRLALALNRIVSAPLERGGRATAVLSRAAASTQEPIARRRLRLALETLTRGRVVVTDRLHGHILSTLAGIPHVVLDNASGKSRAMYETWTSNCEIVRFAGDLDGAAALAQELLAASPAAVEVSA
jgi:pyruvyl transferase EpsO